MSMLTRWEPLRTRMNPFRELEEMEKRLSTISGVSSSRPDGEKEALTMAEWSPLVDITEDEKEYLIKAEVPEIKKREHQIAGARQCVDHLR